MKRIFAFLLLTFQLLGATTYTDFYVQTTGSNLNAGSTTADAAVTTATNGNWDATTGVFICAGATDLSAAAVGQWASIYNDGATVGVFVGRITAVVDATDTVTVSLTAKSGTAPTTSGTARTMKIGGAWKGPNAAENFPFNFVQSTMTDSSSSCPRVNIKGGTTYNVTAAIAHNNAGPIRWEGYTTTAGDGGRCTIDGGNPSSSFTMLTFGAVNMDVNNIIVQNNGTTTGAGAGIAMTSGEGFIRNCVAAGCRGIGIRISSVACVVVECEAYNCNKSNTAATGVFSIEAAGTTCTRCIAHDNTGSNTAGFQITGSSATIDNCIADSNGGKGFVFNSTVQLTLKNCDAYANASDGLDLLINSASIAFVENCNFIQNGGWGINSSGSTLRNGLIKNCGFGAGTAVNSSGAINTSSFTGMQVEGTVTYASNVTPWTDPANGDFRINLAAAKGTGRGSFTETASSYAGTIGYPDIGAAQHLESTGGERVAAYVQ